MMRISEPARVFSVYRLYFFFFYTRVLQYFILREKGKWKKKIKTK